MRDLYDPDNPAYSSDVLVEQAWTDELRGMRHVPPVLFDDPDDIIWDGEDDEYEFDCA